MKKEFFRFVFFASLALTGVRADPLTAQLAVPPPAESGYFKMGTARSPTGHELTLDSRSLQLDGKAWVPAMGEFHYSRYPADEWREELLKMKAGGIDVVSTYVFWIHHEEVEGVWDWSGQRDLRRFVEAAGQAGLTVIVRCGPWCHGEVRNGGLPEWMQLSKDVKRRSTDPRFLDHVRTLYGQIAQQLHGLLWKEGGPVIGIQVDNEFRGPAEYLLALKAIAREAGLDVPLYTRTGWPDLTTPMPLGEILPLYGVYAEGFWDRDITPMPSRYWAGFHFSSLRTDVAIATEMLGKRDAKDAEDVLKYPFLTCEIGGGMMNSYHRRILVDPRDIESTTLIKVAGGSTLPGYYMYHGGTNPDGKLTTLMEAQNTAGTNYNDLPTKTYDFQAPLGEFGQIRPHYHTQRRLHLFLRDFGDKLAGMTTVLPDVRPTGKDDSTTLRWAVRSDGESGFVFVNNYERLKTLPEKTGVQFALKLASGAPLTFPEQPVTIPANATFFWPFNLPVGDGMRLVSATVQPVCVLDYGDDRTMFFAETPGVAAQMVFRLPGVGRVPGKIEGDFKVNHDGNLVLSSVPSRKVVADFGHLRIVILSAEDSLSLWKGEWRGFKRVFLARGSLVIDGDALRIATAEAAPPEIAIYPAPTEVLLGKTPLAEKADGAFRRYVIPGSRPAPQTVALEEIQPAGPLREIKNGPIKAGVPQAPGDADFGAAAVWRIKLPADLDLSRDPLLRFHYTGDVARVTLNGKLLTDDFYNGNALDLGLRRFAPDILKGELRLAVLPLRKDAPIYLAKTAWPDFGGAASVAAVRSVELITSRTVTLTATP